MTLKVHYALCFKTRASFGTYHENLNEDRLHFQWRRCSPMTLGSDNVRFMRIFARVPWKGGVIQQWGNRKCFFRAFERYVFGTLWCRIRTPHTGDVWGTTYPPLLRYVPRRGYNAIYVVHLRGTTGYSWPQKVTQFTFGFSTWKFFFCTICYNIDTENLTYSLVSYILHCWRTGKAPR